MIAIIEVKGGCVTDVTATGPLNYCVYDHDADEYPHRHAATVDSEYVRGIVGRVEVAAVPVATAMKWFVNRKSLKDTLIDYGWRVAEDNGLIGNDNRDTAMISIEHDGSMFRCYLEV